MAEPYFVKIKLPVPNLDWNSAWNSTAPEESPRWKSFYDHKAPFWDKEIQESLKSVDLIPRVVRIFCWKANSLFDWHTDGTPTNPTMNTTNWVVEGQGSVDFNSKLKLHNAKWAFNFLKASLDDEIECSTDGNFCLLNPTIPHRVNNSNTSGPRTTISILWSNSKGECSFEEVLEKFKLLNYV